MKNKLMLNKVKGYALVELVIALGVFSIIVFAIMQLFLVAQEATSIGNNKLKASGLLLEYSEELKNLQRHSWDSLTNGRYIIGKSGSNLVFQATSSAETVNNFNRYLTIAGVYRDALGNIVPTGTLDSSTKKASIFVSWQGLHPSSFSQEVYLTRYLENFFWTQTTTVDFNAGIMDMVKLVNPPTGDGEVQLEGGCGTNPTGAWIFDDTFQNDWDIHPSAKNNIKEVTQPPGQVYEGQKALELSSFGGNSTKLRNRLNICTLGFTRLEFYAYNSAAIPQSFKIGGHWDQQFVEVNLPPQSWQKISLPYADVSGGNEVNFDFIFFQAGNFQTGTKFYLDNVTLTGGVGGYFTEGTLISSIFDSGKISAFNRISFTGATPPNTQVGFQTAVSSYSDGPWAYYGPGGTGISSDLYTIGTGQGIWLGANIGRYFRYKAFLKSTNGVSTPILNDVTINYSP